MKNNFKFFVSLVAIFSLLTATVFAQFTKTDAANLVLNTILANDIGKVDVFASGGSVSGTVELVTTETIACPYNDNWVFFVDDKPWAGWFHECRYIFVDAQSGAHSIINSTVFPRDQLTAYDLISEETGNPPADLSVTSGYLPETLPPNDHYYAVIIAVVDYSGNEQCWYDVSLVYNTLIQIYGYKKENIFVHYYNEGTSPTYGDDLDGLPYSDDLDYPASSDAIHATFNELAGNTSLNNDIPALESDDQLAIFVVDAPVVDDIPGLTLWAFWDENPGGFWLNVEDPLEIAQIVDQIDCAQMTMAFSFNSAGGVVDEFNDYSGQAACGSRYIHYCNYFGDKHDEKYISGGQFSGEYFYYWAAAARGFYPYENTPWVAGIETGSFPFTSIPGLVNHPGDFDPDDNGDGFVQMEEAFYYADAMDTWSDDGYYYNPWEPGEEEIPGDFDGTPFIEDVLTMAGYAGLVETEISLDGSYVIGGELSFAAVTLPYKFEFEDNSEIFMVNPQAKITILEDSKVDLGSNMIIAGNSITNQIKVQGKLTESASGIAFMGIDDGQWKGLVYDDVVESNFNQLSQVSFTDCLISGNTTRLSLNEVEFTNSGIYLSTSYFSLANSVLTNSYTDITHNFSGYEFVDFYKNDFWGNGIIKPAVKLNACPNFNFFDTYINDHSGGIKIYNSGTGASTHLLKGSYIHNCSGSGISIYHSTVDLEYNSSNHNDYGIMIYDRSTVGLIGNEKAEYVGETQRFTDNDSYEFYCSRSSFPHTFRWNVLKDEDNTEPMVYVSGMEGPFDVRHNAWGLNFDPIEDFYPWPAYIYEPIWTLMYDESEESYAESLYYSSTAAEADSNYSLAQAGYYQIIENYPESNYSKAAMKKLLNIESYVDNDYATLKSYYTTNQTIQNNDDLAELAEFLVNFCEIKLENWPTAIAWFENVIQNPESIEDSIFAIIDLGYTYFLMEQSGYKNSYNGTMFEHIPVSTEQFTEKRDFLLSLLPGDGLSKTMKENINRLMTGKLLQNVPNPVNTQTQIWYKLEIESKVILNVFNSTGQIVYSVNEGLKTKGNHYIDFDATGLKNGIYFYSISINGQTTDSKKMTIMK
jgi:hypothetical protein